MSLFSISQNNALIINGAYITMSSGTVASPIYLVINQPNVLGITRTTGWIISEGDGNFVKWNCGATNASYVFPFGVSTTDYIPFTFNKTAGATNIYVSTYGTINDNTTWSSTVTNMGSVWGGSAIGSVIDRWWRVNATGNTADMTFSYKASENTTTTTPTGLTKSQEWDVVNGWLAPTGSGSAGVIAGVGTVNSGSTTSFSANQIVWILSRDANPLPIELISFNGYCNTNTVILKWSTSSETNNNFFTVEKSNNGISFDQIGTINGSGNSTSNNNYSFIDYNPYDGVGYYRLKQTDYDGNSEYFNIVSVSSCNDRNLKVVKMTNLLGQEVNDDYDGVIIYYFIDGSAIKKYNIR